MKKLLSIPLLFMVLLVANSCTMEKKQKAKTIDRANMDLTANPVEDFFQYANGGWTKLHPIPAEKSRYGSFTQLRDENENRVKLIVDEISKVKSAEGTVEQKIGSMFLSGMDVERIEKVGIDPLKPYIERIEAIKDLKSMQELLADFRKQGMEFIFGFYGSTDAKNSNFQIAQLSQSGLGLPDRSYYFDEGEESENIRTKYEEHLQHIFELSGVETPDAESAVSVVFDIEKQLAQASLTRTEMRDVMRTYNKMSLDEVDQLMANFDWKKWFAAIGLPEPGEINVGMPNFFKALDKMLVDVDIQDWKWYLKWHLINANVAYLSNDFVMLDFDFYSKLLSGQEEIRPRWKRVLDATNGVLSEAIGEVYVKKYFSPEAKKRMEDLVANLRVTLGQRIKMLDWMSDETKALALEKLATIKTKIGYPDKWKDYSDLEIKEDSYLENILRARQWGFNEMLGKINKPVDKSEWFMPPQMVNAYYNPPYNEIVFPAGILQPPFFFADGDDAVNYGAIGMVIGHEMTHGFDDKGRLFDKDGNMTDWWTPEDAERFGVRAQNLVDQFNSIVVIDTIMANGELSLGENIADLGGLNIAYSAFKNTEQFKKGEKIDGFTPEQRFFLSYAHVWAQNIRDKEKIRLTKVDVHSLGKNRVNVPLRNLPDFHKAFGAKSGDYMYLPEEERAYIW